MRYILPSHVKRGMMGYYTVAFTLHLPHLQPLRVHSSLKGSLIPLRARSILHEHPSNEKSPPLSQKMRSKSSSCKFILLGERRRQKRCTSGTEQRVCNSIRVLILFRQIWPFAETGIPDRVYAINTCFVSLDPNKYEQLNHQHPRPLQLRALSTAFRDL